MADDRDFVDVESDDDDGLKDSDLQFENPADKRAHHNALERKRRDHIKESFNSLRDVIPSTAGEKSSRAQILKNATTYISSMKNKATKHHNVIEVLKEENKDLESQVLAMERLVDVGGFAAGSSDNQSDDSLATSDEVLDPVSTDYSKPPKRKRVRA